MLFGEEAATAPPDLGRMIAGGAGERKREAFDYYPTPPEATRALLRVEGDRLRDIGMSIWEPCGRGGAILRELEAAGFKTVGSDIVPDLAENVRELDVLRAEKALAPVAITNPPFNIAAQIIVHLLGKLELEYMALLLKATYWHAAERTELFQTYRPARIYALTWRPDFLGQGAPTMDCVWCVWDGYAATTAYHQLHRREPEAVLL
jgi:hypothetical protein